MIAVIYLVCKKSMAYLLGCVHEQTAPIILLKTAASLLENRGFRLKVISSQVKLPCHVYSRFCFHFPGEPAKYDPSFNGPIKNR